MKTDESGVITTHPNWRAGARWILKYLEPDNAMDQLLEWAKQCSTADLAVLLMDLTALAEVATMGVVTVEVIAREKGTELSTLRPSTIQEMRDLHQRMVGSARVADSAK